MRADHSLRLLEAVILLSCLHVIRVLLEHSSVRLHRLLVTIQLDQDVCEAHVGLYVRLVHVNGLLVVLGRFVELAQV